MMHSVQRTAARTLCYCIGCRLLQATHTCELLIVDHLAPNLDWRTSAQQATPLKMLWSMHRATKIEDLCLKSIERQWGFK